MNISIEKMFAKLLFWLYDMLDAISEMFGVLAGTEKLEYDGYDITLLDIFMQHSTVTQVFLALLLVSVGVCAICMVVGVVKGVIAIRAENRHSPMHTVGLGFMAFLASLVMVVVLFAGIAFSNELLQALNTYVFQTDGVSLSSKLFDLSVESTYITINADVDDCESGTTYTITYQGEVYEDVPKVSEGLGYYIEELKYYVTDAACDKVEEDYYIVYEGVKYYDYYATYDEEGNVDGYKIYTGSYDENGKWTRAYESGYNTYKDENGNTVYYTASDIDFSEMSVDEVFGVHKKVMGIFEDGDKGYTTEPMVYLDSFNMWTAYLTVVIIIAAMLWAMIGLVKRLYDLVMLFLIMPIMTATIPLDEGARFKTWRDTVVSKIILAYGTILAVNVFLLFVPIIGEINLTFASATANNIFKIFLYIGGALCISGGQLLVARLAGTDASESREMAQAGRTLLSAGRIGIGAAAGAKRLAVGGTNRYGRETRGILPSALGVGNKAAETAGGGKYMNSDGAYVMRKLSRAPSNDRRDAANKAHGEARQTKYETKTNKSLQKAEDKGRFDKSAMSAGQKMDYRRISKEYNSREARQARAADNRLEKAYKAGGHVMNPAEKSPYSQSFNDYAKSKYGVDFSNASYINKAPSRSQELAKDLAVPKQGTAQDKKD